MPRDLKTKYIGEELPFPHHFVRGNYTNFYLMHPISEADVVNDILHLLRGYKVDAAVIDAGGRRARGQMTAAARAAGLQIGNLSRLATGGGIPKGYADIEATLAPDGRSLFIEAKQPMRLDACGKIISHGGAPSTEQLEFLHEKHRRGALVMVAWSADEVHQHFAAELEANRKAITGHAISGT